MEIKKYKSDNEAQNIKMLTMCILIHVQYNGILHPIEKKRKTILLLFKLAYISYWIIIEEMNLFSFFKYRKQYRNQYIKYEYEI